MRWSSAGGRDVEVSQSAYIVLGLIARHGPSTPYELKARVEQSLGFFWPVPHAQLYRDTERLAALGLLVERTESHGRRRRVFAMTETGRKAVDRWLADPSAPEAETRDPAQLKLFFADLGTAAGVVALASAQAARHRAWRDLYRERRDSLDSADAASVARSRVLELGILHEQAYVDFWETLAGDPTRTDRLATPSV
jgi:DNA-binding PadR family transcriptional regulator